MEVSALTGEGINDLFNRIKFMKSVISDITSYFVSSYKEELEEYLNKGGFYNDIKDKEILNTMPDNNPNLLVEKKIRKTRPQSFDKKKYEGFSSNDYYNRQGNNMINYHNNAFEAIIQENRQEAGKSDRNVPSRFNQIDQLDDRNNSKYKGFLKNIFSFGSKK